MSQTNSDTYQKLQQWLSGKTFASQMKWDMLESGNLRIKTVNWYKPNNKFMGKTKPYFQIITEGIRVYSACIRVGRSMGASMHCDIHLGDIQIDTPVYERWYMMLHFQSSKLTDAKTLNACKKCQLHLQILEQGKILRLDIGNTYSWGWNVCFMSNYKIWMNLNINISYNIYSLFKTFYLFSYKQAYLE